MNMRHAFFRNFARMRALVFCLLAAGIQLCAPLPSVRAFANTIANPSFETGDLTGWTVVSGTAFSNAAVAADSSYWNKQAFHQHNFWHIRDGRGDNSKVGVLQSETFTLGGDGAVDFLIGGSSDINNLYVALVRDSDGVELMKATGSNTDAYTRVNWNAAAYVGTVVSIKIVDNSTTGHINVDDFHVPQTASLHGHVQPALYNPDFELTDLVPNEIKGWTSVSGDAFVPSSLVHDDYFSDGGTFNQDGAYHLWGFKARGDSAVGVLKSETFTLGGNGGIDFLIGGGRDINNLYVALVRLSDGAELFKETGSNSEAYRRVFWDASAYIGQDLYIKIVDNSTGSWGHINADDFNVFNSIYSGGLAGQWHLNEGMGTTATDTVSGYADPIAYHLNTGVYQTAQNPLWKSDGISGGALLFDGYSTAVTHPANRFPTPTKAITVEAWVAPRNFESGADGRLSAIVNQHNREAKEGFILGNYRSGVWGFQFGTGTDWREIMSDKQLPLDEWSYVVATYSSDTGLAALYLNGQQAASANFPAGQPILASDTDLLIGKNNQAFWLYGFNLNSFSGLVDEVKIRNQVLPAADIQNTYNSYLSALGGNLPTANDRIDRSILASDSQRPQYHAEPPSAWQNEPGGAIYFNGQYHVFYQSNPRGPYWDNIRWGHLVSSDMVHWRDAQDAVVPEKNAVDIDGAWAGGSVLDGNGIPVIFYTAGDNRRTPNQRINIARSTFAQDGDNDLNRWTKSPKVVVDQQAGQGILGEFRDPFVFKDGSTWFMLVTSGIQDAQGNDVGGTALVYSTADPTLESGWTYRGPLYVGNYAAYPQTGRVWELPNLRPLGTSGKYIFMINPAKMSSSEYQSRYTYYWIGTWNPTTAQFTPDNATPRLLDVGEHFTGPASGLTPDGRTVIYSIAQGRRTATMDSDAGYAHNFGLPLNVYLRPDGRLGEDPITELTSLRGTQLVNITTDTTFAAANTALSGISSDMYEIVAEIAPGQANEVGFSLRRSPGAEELTNVYYKKSSTEFWVDRTKGSLNPDVEKWYQGGGVDIGTDNIKLHIYVDRSMIEAYLNGLKSLTTRAYPTRSDAKGIQLYANAGSDTVVVKSLQVWAMNSAYTAVNPTSVSLPATKTIMNGDSQLLQATVSPSDATNKDVVWASSNPAVASVINGNVTANAVGTATITATTRIGGFTATSAITVAPEPTHGNLINPDFDDNLSGWTTLSGDAFSNLDVTTASDWGWGGPFNQSGSSHFWGAKNTADSQTGSMRSQKFILGGNGQIDFLIGGGNNYYDLYVALVRASDGKELFKATGGDREAYSRVNWDASYYIGTQCYIEVVDNATGAWGHINVDDFHVPTQAPTTATITNPDFETGNLTGWTVVSGTAFSNPAVASDTGWGWGWGCCFNQNGAYHVWGYKAGGDAPVGVMQSTAFTLDGSGWVDFLIGGGNDINNEYVALARASDGTELMKATGNNNEQYSRVYWDASAYLGEQVYIKVVDNSTGSWGHINVDDFHVFNTVSDIATGSRYQQYRETYHFAPNRKWMNDPDGLVYYNGEYHLFYQKNPAATTWGPMFWGHAVSTDLVNWQDRPIALEHDSNGYIWSGSVVVDTYNTSGFQTGADAPMVAIFTQENSGVQVQSIAYSNDSGRTWTKYASNPVIAMPTGLTVFRDPKVFWNSGTNNWVMAISAGDRVRFYTSANLKTWTYASEFGSLDGSHGGTWECPDLYQLPVDGNPANTKWVLSVSIRNGAPAGGSGIQYFVGQFSGTTFTNDNPSGTVLWRDDGSDNYAGTSFNNIPATDGRRIEIGWMNNWNYGQSIPASVSRSAMTLPREAKLVTVGSAVYLATTPVTETNALRSTAASWTNQTIIPGSNLLSALSGNAWEIVAEFQNDTATAAEYGFKVRKGATDATVVGYDKTASKMFVDRTASGESKFNSAFAARHEVVMPPENNKVTLRIFVDRASVEAFGNNGKAVITDQIFPLLADSGLELYATGGNVTLNSLTVYNISPTAELSNYDFETGDLTGWTVVSGTAFSNSSVTSLTNWGWGGTFKQNNKYHLYGYLNGGDSAVGALQSQTFTLGGSGKIDFLIGGGNNIGNLYVALVRASDGAELMKATGNNSEMYSQVIWDASAYVNTQCFIKIVDNNTGDWGHLNVDDIHVPLKKP